MLDGKSFNLTPDEIQMWSMPTKCPVCGGDLKVDSAGKVLCVNPDCVQKLEHALNKFFSVMDIKGAGPSFVREFTIIHGKHNIIGQFLSLLGHEDIMCACAGGINGRKIIANTNAAIAKPISVSKFIACFDFEGFGEDALDAIKSWTLEQVLNATKADMMKLDGWSDISSESFINQIQQNKDMLKEVSYLFKFDTNAAAPKGTKFAGMSFQFTGKTAAGKRSDLEKLVTDNGGTIAGVTKKLSYLVTDDTESGSAKNVKAKELGVPVISSQEFMKLVEA